MEFKVIFYILVALGWLVSKVLSARSRSSEGASGPVPSTVIGDREVIAGERKARSRDIRKSGNTGAAPGRSSGRVFRSSPAKTANTSVVMDTAMQEGGIVTYDREEVREQQTIPPSLADTLAEEIRSGRMDWRRQVIISELLTKRYV